jgi:hypothetical protein
VSGCLVPASALADGGSSIASAPSVVYGQQQFGNTANGSNPIEPSQYWLLSVTAGDLITIDWESHAYPQLHIYPIGTTDFSLGNAYPFKSQDVVSVQNELVFTAPRTGAMPMEFFQWNESRGPYDFTAYVRHAIRLGLPRTSKLHRKATLPVSVHNAEGGVISDPALQVDVQIKRRKGWQIIGSAPVGNAIAAVKLDIPARYAGKKISLRAYAHGSGYATAASRTLRVRVAGKSLKPS